jgi:hypothetical protein
MNKKIKNSLIIILTVFSLFMYSTVYAEELSTSSSDETSVDSAENGTSYTDDLNTDQFVTDNSGSLTCSDLLGDKDDESSLMHIISLVYNILKVFAVTMVVILGMLDFSGAVATSDNDKLSKAIKTFTTRLILLVVFFLIPTFVNLVLGIIFGEEAICLI